MFNSLVDSARNIFNIQKSKENNEVVCENIIEVEKVLNSRSTHNLILYIKPSRLKMHGGLSYDLSHPFLQAMRDGKSALMQFYQNFQPKNLAEMYSLVKISLSGEDLPPWVLPWMPEKINYAPTEEEGLSLSHGVSFYGPASLEKMDLEYTRLKSIEKSINEKGYDTKIGGHISGWFMQSGDDFVFFVRGGKHRAAVLTYLNPEGLIPVILRQDFPKAFFGEQSPSWDQVKNGSIDEKVAKNIFNCYFKKS
jgi:hypothetical protein